MDNPSISIFFNAILFLWYRHSEDPVLKKPYDPDNISLNKEIFESFETFFYQEIKSLLIRDEL